MYEINICNEAPTNILSVVRSVDEPIDGRLFLMVCLCLCFIFVFEVLDKFFNVNNINKLSKYSPHYFTPHFLLS